MESLEVAANWILQIVIVLFVPALVWVAVIVGLISIVRDKVRKEETALSGLRRPATCCRVQGEHKIGRPGAQVAAKDRPEWAIQPRIFALTGQSGPIDAGITQAIQSEKELKP